MLEISFDEISQLTLSKFHSRYQPITTLSTGPFSTVIKSKDLHTNTFVAIKILSKLSLPLSSLSQLQQEITLLQHINHPNIVTLLSSFETSSSIYIIMEYIHGGTLMNFITSNKGNITESQSKQITFYILTALSYLHNHNICHRDIKPDNIMFNENGNLSTLKIIDFGLSTFIDRNKEDKFCGTVMYMAPESLFGRKYSKEIDLWSLGIVLFMLLNQGRHPFYEEGDSKEEYKKKCKKERIRMFYHVSRNAKSLLAHLMEFEERLRYTAEEALKHRWFWKRDVKEGNIRRKGKELMSIILFMIYWKEKRLKRKERIYGENKEYGLIFGNLKKNATQGIMKVGKESLNKNKEGNAYINEIKNRRNNSFGKQKMMLSKQKSSVSPYNGKYSLFLNKIANVSNKEVNSKRKRILIMSQDKINHIVNYNKAETQRNKGSKYISGNKYIIPKTERKIIKQLYASKNNEMIHNYITIATEENSNTDNSKMNRNIRYKKQSLVLPFITKHKPNYKHCKNNTII